MRVPAALAAIPLLAGAALGVHMDAVLSEADAGRLILAACGAAVLSLLAGLAFRAESEGDGLVLALVIGAAASGYATAAAQSRAVSAPPLLAWFDARDDGDSDPVTLTGRLRDDGAFVGYGVLLTIDVEEVEDSGEARVWAAGGVRLTVVGSAEAEQVADWRAGRTVRVPASLRRPITFSNPGVSDERLALARRGIVLVGTVKSASLVEVRAAAQRHEEWAAVARAWTRRTITRHVGRHDPRSAAVATAILIGDRSGLSEDDERRLQDAGTYHVIAISGGNIAILTALLVFGARALRVPDRIAAGLSICVLLAYGEVAGGSASVGRAITGAVIFLAALLIDQRGAPLNVVAVAAMLAVAARPVSISDGGFLLSFGATAGIILGVPRLFRVTTDHKTLGLARWWRLTLRAAGGVLAATICAEIVLTPIGASLFSRVTFAGLALNLAAIPLMTAVQCGSMLLLAAAALYPSVAGAAGTFVHYAATGLVESSRLVTLAPWLARDVPPPAGWICVLYYGLCVGWLLMVRGRRLIAIALAGAGMVIVTGRAPGTGRAPVLLPGILRVVILDVGQGDATLVMLPNGTSILVDAGGLAGTSYDIGSRVVVPALRAFGVTRLHALVATHGDPDHIDGAAVLLKSLPVANVWEGVPVPPHPALQSLTLLAGERRIMWRTLLPGDSERAAGVEIRVLHPPTPDWERQRVRNDDSVVLEIRYRDVSILLPGDIGSAIERSLVSQLTLGPLVILKAAHHGSATSSSEEFIDATRPEAVIFSAGRGNRFGHPAAVVAERFTRRNVAMFNTAHDGAVFVETDGKSVEVYGWKTRRTMTTRATQEGRQARRSN